MTTTVLRYQGQARAQMFYFDNADVVRFPSLETSRWTVRTRSRS